MLNAIPQFSSNTSLLSFCFKVKRISLFFPEYIAFDNNTDRKSQVNYENAFQV